MGRVLDALENGPNKDNTIVVLWSDHGWHLGEKQHWQKFTGWRVCTRVPLMIKVPNGVPGLQKGTKAGSVTNKPVDLLSLFPTLTELCGLPAKQDNDGRSLVKLLSNPKADWPHAAYTHVNHPGSVSISLEDWRYIHYAGGDEELYHTKKDPYEWTNLAANKAHAKTLAKFRKLKPKKFAPLVPTREKSLPKLKLKTGKHPPSKPEGKPFEVYFANETGQDIQLFWSNRKGELVPYAGIAPGKSKRQQTRPGAVWVIQDAKGTQFGYFSVGDRKARAVVTKDGNKWIPTSNGKCPKSKDGGGSVSMKVRNNRTTGVKMYWINQEGKRAQEYDIEHGSFMELTSFEGHAFEATDSKGKLLGHFVAGTEGVIVDIPAIKFPNPGAGKPAADRPIQSPPCELELDPFYKKVLNYDGYLICSSEKVSDYALREAAYLIELLVANRPDILKALADGGSRMTIMAHDEFTTDVPEHARIPKTSNKSADWWDRRARGLGGSEKDPVASCGEENLLCFDGDPYHKENILIHEFAHTLHLRGLNRIDPNFDKRLRKIWKQALEEGLWAGKYPSVAHTEYFAEGVQSWFNNNRENDHDHNHVNTRAELKEYDPRLAKMLEEIFGSTELEYIKPQKRCDQAHMKGYDYSKAPKFAWPPRLKTLDKAIRRPGT